MEYSSLKQKTPQIHSTLNCWTSSMSLRFNGCCVTHSNKRTRDRFMPTRQPTGLLLSWTCEAGAGLWDAANRETNGVGVLKTKRWSCGDCFYMAISDVCEAIKVGGPPSSLVCTGKAPTLRPSDLLCGWTPLTPRIPLIMMATMGLEEDTVEILI